MSECRRCGHCCKSIPCGIGLALVGDHRPCKALEKCGEIYVCGLVAHCSYYVDLGKNIEWKDEFLGNMFKHMLGIGRGCCSSPETDLFHEEVFSSFKKIKRFPKSLQRSRSQRGAAEESK